MLCVALATSLIISLFLFREALGERGCEVAMDDSEQTTEGRAEREEEDVRREREREREEEEERERELNERRS